MQKTITIVCGPTSTGKSNFVLSLAKKSLPSVIISADSRQFYKDLPIVSGQDNLDNFPEGVTLVGQGFLDSNAEFSISQFQKYFHEQVDKFQNHNIFVVGGSGLYLKAISQNIETISIPQNKNLREKLDTFSLADLQEELRKINIKKFNLLNNSDLNNPRRLIRAIEVAEYTKKTTSQSGIIDFKSNICFNWIGLKTSDESLKEKINQRTQQRLDGGAVEEVQKLLENYPDQSLPIYTTLGVSEIIDFLNKKISREELLIKWVNADFSYAKRQMVWFKKQAQIVWYDNGI